MLNYGCEFVSNPDKVLEPAISYQILTTCMRTGAVYAHNHKLSDYFNDKKTDYVGARAIINGSDKAKTIAGYAKKFQAILELSSLEAN